MNQSLWISKTGLDAQQTKLSTIANNLANASTAGFKKSRAVFEDLLYQNVRQVGAQSSADTQLPSGLMLGLGVRTVATEKLFNQGNLVETGNAFDMAIEGRGFFEVLMPDGSQKRTGRGNGHRHQERVGADRQLVGHIDRNRCGDQGGGNIVQHIGKRHRDDHENGQHHHR